MIIYFSPEFVGNEYVGFNKEDDIRLDVQYLGIEGLVDFLQMHIGMHRTAENLSSYDRKIAIPYRAGTIPSSVVQLH